MVSKSPNKTRSHAWPAFLLAFCLFVWISQITYDPGDWPTPHRYPQNVMTHNACGAIGAFVAYHLRRVFGDGVYPLALFGTAAAVLWLVHGRIVRLAQRVFGLILVVVCTCASVHLISSPGPDTLEFGNGGIVGAAVGPLLCETFSRVGTVLVLGYCLLVGLLFTAEGWVLRISRAVRSAAQRSGEAIAAAGAQLPSLPPMPVMAAAAAKVARPIREAAISAKVVRTSDDVAPPARSKRSAPESQGDKNDDSVRSKAPGESPTSPPSEPRLRFHGDRGDEGGDAKRQAGSGALVDEMDIGAWNRVEDEFTPKRASPSSSQRRPVVDSEPDDPIDETDEDENGLADGWAPDPAAEAYPKKLDDWKLPSLTMLDDPEYTFSAAQESVLRAKAKTLERALQEFRLDARVVEIDTGPVITMFELDLGAGIKVSQISSLANDIARALKATSIRIIAPIPGKNTVGVEVPNADKEKVRLKALLLSGETQLKQMAVPLFLGKDASGKALITDLTAMPHMLIAGTTGSGKSVSINTIIMSILMSRRPDMVKLILIDPKMVEMSQFKDVPHLMAPIVTDMARAEQILEWAVTKMDERYALIAEARVRNIGGYNQLGEEEIYHRLQPSTEQERKQIPTHLPYIVIVIDELADLMMTSAKEVEHHLSRLAQKSRAVGIHIVVATQRPEAKVVTGLIKSNLPCRCAFRVASRMDSRIVLDQNGAEVLMGQGDMLFLPPGSHKLIRAQGTCVEDHELQRVIDYLAKQGKAEFHPELVRIRAKGADSIVDRDPLFERAVEVVMETQRGSVSLLQRRLTIGYSRASRLIEQMAAAGVVGDYKGSQAREVIVSREEWEAMRAAHRAGQSGAGRSSKGNAGDDVDSSSNAGASDVPWEDAGDPFTEDDDNRPFEGR